MWKKSPILFLALLTFSIYFFSFFNEFVWDDEQFIYKNQFVKNFSVKEIFITNTIAGAGEISNYYRPLTTLSFAIDYQFWGLNPFGYHLVNTLLHIATGVMIYKLLLRLKFNQNASFVAALIFLIHPLQTEAVTYINSRGDSLYSFFLLASLVIHSYLFNKKNPSVSIYQHHISFNTFGLLILTVASYLASILSKEIALAGLGLHGLLILRFYMLVHTSVKKFLSKYIWSIYVFILNLLVVISYLGLRATVLNFQNTFNFFDDTSIYSENILVRLLTFFKIIFIYIKLILFPYPLHMERTTGIITSPINIWLFAFVVVCTALIVLSFWQWKKYKDTTIFFGWAWITIMLIPVSGIVAINGLLYEHWLYLPIVGFSIVFYEIIRLLFPRLIASFVTKYIFLAVVTVLCLLTLRQNYLWSTPIRLYNHLLQHTDSARIHNNLAMAYSEKNNYGKAIEHYQLSLQYGMPYPQIYHNMANTYVATGQLEQAEAAYKEALEIDQKFFHTYPNLISLYIQQKKFDSALEVVFLAQQQYPDAVYYHLYELEIYKAANNIPKFEEKKNSLLKNYDGDPEVTTYINRLQLVQE